MTAEELKNLLLPLTKSELKEAVRRIKKEAEETKKSIVKTRKVN